MNFLPIYKSVTSELVLEVGDFGEDLGVFGLCAQSRVGPSTDYLMYSTLACYQTANIGGLTRHAEMPLCKIFGLIAAFRERHLLVYTLLCQIIIAVVTFYSVIIISYYDTFSTSTPRAVAIRSSFNDAKIIFATVSSSAITCL